MSFQKLIDKRSIEIARNNFRQIAPPPVRLLLSVMETDTPELPRIAKDQAPVRLPEKKMIVPGGGKRRSLHPHGSGHAQMDAERVIAGKTEEHAFAPRFRAEKFFARQTLPERARVRGAKDPFLRMYLDLQDPGAQAGIPLFAIPLHFRQLGHDET